MKCNPGSVHESSIAPPLLQTPIWPESITWKAPAQQSDPIVNIVKINASLIMKFIRYLCKLLFLQKFHILQIRQKMIGNIILLGGISLISAGFIVRRKEQFFKNFYSQIQKSKKFHLDFVDQLGKLPLDTNIILFGGPKSQTQKDKILCKSIIKRGKIQKPASQNEQRKQFQFPKEDRLWKFSLKQQFYLQTLSNEKVFVQENKNQEVYAFNLMRRNYNNQWQQRVIVKNQPVCVYGKLSKLNQKMILKTNLIMGTKNETFLTYLDTQILKLRFNSKILTLSGIGVFGLHALYKYYFSADDASSKVQNVVKIPSQEEKILAQIKRFQKQNKK